MPSWKAPSAGTGSCYVRLEYRRQMEIAVVGAAYFLIARPDRKVGQHVHDTLSVTGSARKRIFGSSPLGPLDT